jgi:oxygen-independent coproporphyrinogen-3 oxidase
MPNFTQLPALSLYIHIPWCVRKCPYCDFNSHEIREQPSETQYLNALLADLEQDLPKVWGRSVHSIFIGGGTPSVFSPDFYQRLLTEIRSRIKLLPQAEITLEANPGTVDSARFKGYREAGINRLSLGVQSFQDDMLHILGRIHDAQQAKNALTAIREAGFENFNLDLMFGLSQQTVAMAIADLNTALQFAPPHLSWYQLTLEPNTAFFHQPPNLPDDDYIWEIQEAGQALLAAQGYQHYEISAYSKTGKRCRHNLNYWEFGDYLGIGAGAHGKISDAAQGRITRYSKQRHPKLYLETAHSPEVVSSLQILEIEDICLEFMLNALRLHEGFSEQDFTQHTGLEFELVKAPLNHAYKLGWIQYSNQRIAPTEQGLRFLNELLELFVP